MPKIITNVREQLLTEAKRQIVETGYASTTIRSVASACNLGVGTVYNYFKSKDMLIASFMVDDWQECLAKMKQEDTENAEQFFHKIFFNKFIFRPKNSSKNIYKNFLNNFFQKIRHDHTNRGFSLSSAGKFLRFAGSNPFKLEKHLN